MYHQLDRIPPWTKHAGNYVPPEAFEDQLAALRGWGYTPVTFEEWLAFRGGRGTVPKRPLIITIDDGYRSAYQNAWPILKRAGFPATVFIVSELIGKTNVWDVEKMQDPLLTEAEILEMRDGGISFGSHTATHPALTRIPLSDARSELTRSRRALEELLGSPVKTFCYPYAKQNAAVRALVREAGYEAATIGRGGVNRVWTDPFALRRIKIDSKTSLRSLRRSLVLGRFGLRA